MPLSHIVAPARKVREIHLRKSNRLTAHSGKPVVSEAIRMLLADPRFQEAFEKCKHNPVRGGADKPLPNPRGDMRKLAELIAFLQHETPQRRRLLNAAGLKADDLSSRHCAMLANHFFAVLESDESINLWDQPWRPNDRCWNRDETPPKEGLNTRRLSDVIARDVKWLWPQRVPLGKLTLISGDPDLGKTWTVLDMIARITTGRPFPDSANPFGNRRNALWVSGEDEDEDTIRPRIDMLGGDPTRVHSLAFVLHEGKERTLSLGEHLGHIDNWLRGNPLVSFVALDPFAAFLGKIDSHRNSDVRGLLTPLMKLASKHQVAIVGINHLSKGDGDNAMYRGMGSIAFVAAARSSWMVSRDPKEPSDRRLFVNVKNNLASEDVGGLAFRVGPSHNGIRWEDGIVRVTADEALRLPDNSRAPQRAEAKEWLRDLLKNGSVSAADVWSKAEADGICEKTIKLAKKELGVRTKKTGGTGKPWVWSLPKKN